MATITTTLRVKHFLLGRSPQLPFGVEVDGLAVQKGFAPGRHDLIAIDEVAKGILALELHKGEPKPLVKVTCEPRGTPGREYMLVTEVVSED